MNGPKNPGIAESPHVPPRQKQQVDAEGVSLAAPPPVRTWLLALLLLALVILAYQPVWRAGFIWNDDYQITQNKLVTGGHGWSRVWQPQHYSGAFAPVVYSSFRLEHALWGTNPVGYHWVNLILHALNCLLVWVILRRLRVPGAWLGAAFFGLHPVQVETVAWLSERKNLLSLLFCLLATLAWLESEETTDRKLRRWTCYGLALTCFVLALLSKVTACALPLAWLLILWLRRKAIDWRALGQFSPFLLLGLAMALFSVYVARVESRTVEPLRLGAVERLLVASHAIWFYLGKLLVPVNLTFSYPRWSVSATDPVAWAWLAMLVLLVTAIWFARRKIGRGPAVAFLYFVLMLSPFLGFIALPAFRYSFVADHYQYVACIGPLALAAVGITLGLGRLKAAAAAQPVVVGVLVTVCGLLAWDASARYKNQETLWTITLAKNPNSLLARHSYGRMLLRSGKFEEALVQCRAAVSLDPRHLDSLLDLGSVFYALGKQEEAAATYNAALNVNPQSPEAHANLGVILAKQGKVDEAIQHRRKALELDPKLVQVRVNLAAALAQKGEFAEAVQQYDAALKLNPDQPMAHINMAIALAVLGRVDEAAAHYDKAATTVETYARRLEQQGRVDDAIAQLKEAMRLIPNNARSRYDLAMLYVRQGKPADARPHLNQALLLKPDFPEARKALQELRDSTQ